MAESTIEIKTPADKLDVFLTANERISPHKRSPIKSISSLSSSCRICHDNDFPETLVSPCLCTGSLELVHVSCLEKWLTTSKTKHCEICKFAFKTKKELRPIKEWLLSERGLSASGNFYSDVLCLIFLSPLCFLSIYVCTAGAIRYLEKRLWEGIGLALISFSVLFTYLLWAFITVRFHLRNLRNWQHEHHRVYLLENCSNRLVPRGILQA